jgi:hypothetical protein
LGSIQYDGDRLHFDDRLLAHLQIVIMQKLRNEQSFLMSWLNVVSIGDGRTGIWLHAAIPLRFNFSGSRTPAINRDWLHTLQQSANSSTGLVITDENGQLARCGAPA